MFEGAITALITPMRDGEVDVENLRRLVDFQVSEGIQGLVPCGTTGETPTLSRSEQASVIKTVVEQAGGKVPVIAGAGANNTQQAIELSKTAVDCGADALLHVTPYYNKPTQRGLVAHFEAIADAVERPIVLYNVPGRTGCDLLPDTIAKLQSHARIVAVKEATGSVERGQRVIRACPQLPVLSGEDSTAFALTAAGGRGVISVTSNVAPKLVTQMIAYARSGQIDEARGIHYRLQRLMELMFLESNPIPVKAAVSLLGFTQNELRLPLTPLEGSQVALIQAEMSKIGLL